MKVFSKIEEELEIKIDHQFDWQTRLKEDHYKMLNNYCKQSVIGLRKKKKFALSENVDQLIFTNARLLISFFQVYSKTLYQIQCFEF